MTPLAKIFMTPLAPKSLLTYAIHNVKSFVVLHLWREKTRQNETTFFQEYYYYVSSVALTEPKLFTPSNS